MPDGSIGHWAGIMDGKSEAGISPVPAGRRSPWRDEAVLGRLRALWDDGASLGMIARTLNTEFALTLTRNAVAGQANRQRLPGRLPPMAMAKSRDLLTRAAVDPEARARSRLGAAAAALAGLAASGEPLPALRSAKEDARLAEVAATIRAGLPAPAAAPAASATPPAAREQRPTAPSLGRIAARPAARTEQCRWPIGDPKLPDFTFCADTAAAGRPYCSAHCRLAYTPQPGRRLATAATAAF